MKFTATEFQGLWIIDPERHSDPRGYFCETFRADLFEQATGLRPDFVQDNESESVRGVVRGLHYQTGPYAQAKLVRAVSGEILDVALDLRRHSPTFGRHFAMRLSAENGRQLFIPRGFAHGFAVLSPTARFLYKTDNPGRFQYPAPGTGGIRPDRAGEPPRRPGFKHLLSNTAEQEPGDEPDRHYRPGGRGKPPYAGLRRPAELRRF